MRAQIAARIVMFASGWIGTSFNATQKPRPWLVPKWMIAGIDKCAYYACRLLPVAIKIDYDAATAQMAEECWWG